MMHNRQSALDMTLLLGLWLVWGYSWIASKLGLAYATPLQMAEYRLTLALLTLGGLLLWRRSSWRLPPLWPTLGLGLTQTTGFTLFSTLALLEVLLRVKKKLSICFVSVRVRIYFQILWLQEL